MRKNKLFSFVALLVLLSGVSFKASAQCPAGPIDVVVESVCFDDLCGGGSDGVLGLGFDYDVTFIIDGSACGGASTTFHLAGGIAEGGGGVACADIPDETILSGAAWNPGDGAFCAINVTAWEDDCGDPLAFENDDSITSLTCLAGNSDDGDTPNSPGPVTFAVNINPDVDSGAVNGASGSGCFSIDYNLGCGTPACPLDLTGTSIECSADDSEYTVSIDYVGGDAADTYTVTSIGSSASGGDLDPAVSASGTMTFTFPTGTDYSVTIESTNGCNKVIAGLDPGCGTPGGPSGGGSTLGTGGNPDGTLTGLDGTIYDPWACQCQNNGDDESNNQAVVTINSWGGTPQMEDDAGGPVVTPYTIVSGTGIYDIASIGTNPPASFNFAGGAPTFNWAPDANLPAPFTGLGTFQFLVIADQPFSYTISDGTNEMTLNGVCDVTVAEMSGIADGPFCVDDPPFTIYDDKIFEVGSPNFNFGQPFPLYDATTGMPILDGGALVNDPVLAATIAGAGNVTHAPYVGEFFAFDYSAGAPSPAALNDNQNGTAVFDPFFAGPGQHLISYIVEDQDTDCMGIADEVVNVYPVFDPTFSIDAVQCVSTATPVVLSLDDRDGMLGILGQLELAFDPLGEVNEPGFFVEWSGPGVVDPTAVAWDPANPLASADAGNGTFTPSVAGVGIHTLNVMVGYPNCEQSFAFTVEVVDAVVPTIDDATLCVTPSAAVNLTQLFTATTTEGGTFAVSGVAPAGVAVVGNVVTYDPAAALPFSVVVEYTVGSDDCEMSDTATVTVIDSPQATLDLPEVMCSDASWALEDYVSVVNSEGTTESLAMAYGTAYSFAVEPAAAGVIDATNNFAPDAAFSGLVTIRFSATAGTAPDACMVYADQIVRIELGGTPDFAAGLPANVCAADAQPVAFTVVDATNSNGLTVVPAGPVVGGVAPNYTVDFSAVTETTMFTVSHSTGANECLESASHTVVVYPAADASLTETEINFCEGDAGIADLSVYVAGDQGGVWSGDGAVGTSGIIAGSNPPMDGVVFGWSPINGAGTYVLTYSVGVDIFGAASGCYDESTLTITIVEGCDSDFDIASIVCSSDNAGEPITLSGNEPTFWNDDVATGTNGSANVGELSAVATFTGIGSNAPTPPPAASMITDISITYSYNGTNPASSQGDHDGYSIEGPDGTEILAVADGTAPDGTTGSGSDNHFGSCASCTYAEQTLSADDIIAAYGSLEALSAAFFTCDAGGPAFTFTLDSGSEEWEINIEVTIDWIEIFGSFNMTINETGQMLPDGAFELVTITDADGNVTGVDGYVLNTHFNAATATADFPAGYYDLAAFDEISICYSCEECPDAGTGLTCSTTTCKTIIVTPGGNADIENDPICLDNFDALHLPTAFFIDGVTTPGGVWTIADDSPNGASETAGSGVNGEFFSPEGLAGGLYTVCYSMEEGNALCNPEYVADCVNILVPENYSVAFAQTTVCESCDEDDLVEIIISNTSGVVEGFEPATAGPAFGSQCRDDLDLFGTNLFGGAYTSGYGPTSLLGPESLPVDGVQSSVLQVGGLAIPAGATIDSVEFFYNYISTDGIAQGDHDGWAIQEGMYDAAGQTIPGAVVTSADDAVGSAADNHFPADNSGFETFTSYPGTTVASDDCDFELAYTFAITSNSQYWNSCFEVYVHYTLNDEEGEPVSGALTAVLHENGDLVEDITGSNPIIINDDGYFINTCGLGPLDEIDVIFNPAGVVADACGDDTPESCVAIFMAEMPLVVLEGGTDGDATFTFPETVCAGGTYTLTPATSVQSTDGTTLPIDNLVANTDGSVDITVGATSGLFSIVHTVSNDLGCEFVYTQEVLVVSSPDASLAATASVCSGQNVVNLTQYFIEGATTPGGSFSGPGVSGNILFIDQLLDLLGDPEALQAAADAAQATADADAATAAASASAAAASAATAAAECAEAAADPDDALAQAECVVAQAAADNDQVNADLDAAAADLSAMAAADAAAALAASQSSTAVITYTVGEGACLATGTIEIAIIGSAANIDFDLPGSLCNGATYDLFDYVFSADQSGTFIINIGTATETALAGSSYTASAADGGDNGLVSITYEVGSDDCGTLTDSEMVSVTTESTPSSDSYGFVCQSEDDFSIDLTQYLTVGSANGGTFMMGELPAMITELEYDASETESQNNSREFVEITAAKGTNLADYALFFYERDDAITSGRLYAYTHLAGIIGTSYEMQNDQPTFTTQTQYNSWAGDDALQIGAWVDNDDENLRPAWANPPGTAPRGVFVDIASDGYTFAAANGVEYGSISFDFSFNIRGTEDDFKGAAIALVDISGAPDPLQAGYDPAAAASLLETLNYNNNNDVVQFIGYGVDADNTNEGIFSSCNGPAASMTPVDINVVDQDGSNRSLQFSNSCWVIPDVSDEPLDYDDAPFESNSDGDNFAVSNNGVSTGPVGSPTAANYCNGSGGDDFFIFDNVTSPGTMNWGLLGDGSVALTDATCALGGTPGDFFANPFDGGADEYYYDYLMPEGDILNMDRFCRAVFMVGQTEGGNETEGNDDNDGTSDDDGQDNQFDEGDNSDQGDVRFTCCVPTFTVPLNYALTNDCGFAAQAGFNLTMLMDIEEDWDSPKDFICEDADINLTDLISDDVEWIAPTKKEFDFTAVKDTMFEENIIPPVITELHYEHYGYDGAAADDHCVTYNWVDDAGTLSNDDDTYETWNFCEGIEISAPTGRELSCYSLVFYDESSSPNSGNGVDGSNSNMIDITYIGPDGLPITTDVSNGNYMQLYGTIDDDSGIWYEPSGGLLTVPAFEYSTEWGHFPWYGGVNPIGPNPEDPYGIAPGAGDEGLYNDINGNGIFDLGIDTQVDATNFPWERPTECPKGDVGSRWFPILDVPSHAAGVGILNICNGELINFISWGDAVSEDGGESSSADSYAPLCNETNEGFTLGGPFEQLSSSIIDTIQNSEGNLGDMRTLQLISCSMAQALLQAEGKDITTCDVCDDEDGNYDADATIWVLVYNGGAFTVPTCSGLFTEGDEEVFEFSNSIGHYNCNLAPTATMPDLHEVCLDLSTAEDIPDNFIITEHSITVTIGSDYDENYTQIYTYTVGADQCKLPNELNGAEIVLAQEINTNSITELPGDGCPTDNSSQNGIDDEIENYLNDPIYPTNTQGTPTGSLGFEYVFDPATGGWMEPLVGINPQFFNAPHNDGSPNPTPCDSGTPTNPSVPGNLIAGVNPIQNGGALDTYGYPAFNGWQDCSTPCIACQEDPNACIEGMFAPVMPNWNATLDQLGMSFNNGNSSANVNGFANDVTGDCFIGYCSSLSKTRYFVRDLGAYLYNGNVINGYEDGELDTCRTLEEDVDEFNVSITVNIKGIQCAPIGNFVPNVAGWQAPYYSDNSSTDDISTDCGDVKLTNNSPLVNSDAPISLNCDNPDNPYWVFNADGFADSYGEIEVTYDVTNSDPIEADDVTDDLACLDDDNETQRTKDFTLLPSGSVTLTDPTGVLCEGDDAVSLANYLANGSTPGGTWSGAGVSGGMFDPASAGAGSHDVTYSVSSGDCESTASISFVVEAGAGDIAFSTPATACASEGSLTLTATPAGGTWSGTGVTDDQLDLSAVSGDATVTYSVGSGDCGSSASTTISVQSELSVTAEVYECNTDGSEYTVSFTISGGNGNYTVNGSAADADFTSMPVASGSAINLTVSGDDVCSDIDLSFTHSCDIPCNAEAGMFELADPAADDDDLALYCAEDELMVASADGFTTTGGHTQVYVITTGDDATIVAVEADGDFSAYNLPAGDHQMWGLNFLPGQATIPAVGESAAGLDGCFDLSDAVDFTVLPEVVINADYICSEEAGGYLISVTITGGTPEYNGGFGSYSIEGALTYEGTGTPGAEAVVWGFGESAATALLADQNGMPFPAGATVSVSVSGDGRLCTGGPAVVEIPNDPCALFATDDEEYTEPGVPVTFNILTNDNGGSTSGVVVSLVQSPDPSQGTIVWNEDGTFTFNPAPGFSGQVVLVYEITDAIGQETTATITITVGEESTAPLAVTHAQDCEGAETTGLYTVVVAIDGGTPPYAITGDYNDTEFFGTSFNFTAVDGSSYQFDIVDAAGESFAVNQDVEPCTKVVVELLSYSGEILAVGNNLKWVTASETDNDYFTLEHSIDGVNFTEIAIVEGFGAGTSIASNGYSYLHKEAVAGDNIYRLSATDLDGLTTDHGTITLVRGEAGFGFTNVYPIPTSDVLTVEFNANFVTDAKVDVYDVAGKLISAKTVQTVNGFNATTLNVSSFAAGTYYLTINNGQEVITTKFVTK